MNIQLLFFTDHMSTSIWTLVNNSAAHLKAANILVLA